MHHFGRNLDFRSFICIEILMITMLLFLIIQMGIGILRNQIGFDDTEWSGSIDDIHIDSSFSFKDYKKSIKNLFKSFRKYLSGSSDRTEDVTTENEMINKSSTDLCDILERSKKSGAEGDVISKLKLRILLEKHSLKTLNHYVIQFVNRIQNLVRARTTSVCEVHSRF